MKTTTNSAEVRELVLFATNDSLTYHNSTIPALENLRKKIARNVYDESKAQKMWEYVAEYAARRYAKEFASHGTKWFEVFNAACRRAAALKLMEYYADALEE